MLILEVVASKKSQPLLAQSDKPEAISLVKSKVNAVMLVVCAGTTMLAAKLLKKP